MIHLDYAETWYEREEAKEWLPREDPSKEPHPCAISNIFGRKAHVHLQRMKEELERLESHPWD